MDRAKQLRELAKDVKTSQLIEEMILLEKQLDEFKVLPFYKRSPKDATKIKMTDAYYAYHKTLSVYKEIVKLLLKATEQSSAESSPLRDYLNKIRSGDNADN